MKTLHNDNFIWVILIFVTLVTWFLIEGYTTVAAAFTVIFLSSLKVYLIGISYMEIFKANKAFIIFYHLWIAIVAVMIVSFALVGA